MNQQKFENISKLYDDLCAWEYRCHHAIVRGEKLEQLPEDYRDRVSVKFSDAIHYYNYNIMADAFHNLAKAIEALKKKQPLLPGYECLRCHKIFGYPKPYSCDSCHKSFDKEGIDYKEF